MPDSSILIRGRAALNLAVAIVQASTKAAKRFVNEAVEVVERLVEEDVGHVEIELLWFESIALIVVRVVEASEDPGTLIGSLYTAEAGTPSPEHRKFESV